MRSLLLLLSLLPLWAAALPAHVISASGLPQRGDAAEVLRAGDTLLQAERLRTPADASLQLRMDDGATLSLGAHSDVQLDASAHALDLHSGQLALWSEGKPWQVTFGKISMHGKGFLRLRVCAEGCSERPGLYGKVDGGELVVEYLGGRSLLNGRLFRIAPEGGRPELLARDTGVLDSAADFAAALVAKERDAAQLQQALEDFREERLELARRSLTHLQHRSPGEVVINYYLGLIALQQQRNQDALQLLQQYAREDAQGAREHGIGKLLTLLTSAELQREVQTAVAQEKDLSSLPPEPGSIAVQAFSNRSSPEAAILAKGIAAMVISDLSKVPGLKVLEREKVQKISDELHLNTSGLVDSDSALRVGRLMRAERVVIGNIGVE